MKKKIILLLSLFVLPLSVTNAQTLEERTHFESSVGSGIRHNGITPIDLSFNLHADLLPFLYISIAVEDNISLSKSDGAKTYSKGTSLGGGLGIKLLHRTESKYALDLRVKCLSSVGKQDWKRTTYAASAAWYLNAERFSPVFELGYRFLDSRTKGIDNYGNAYLSFGLRY